MSSDVVMEGEKTGAGDISLQEQEQNIATLASKVREDPLKKVIIFYQQSKMLFSKRKLLY